MQAASLNSQEKTLAELNNKLIKLKSQPQGKKRPEAIIQLENKIRKLVATITTKKVRVDEIAAIKARNKNLANIKAIHEEGAKNRDHAKSNKNTGEHVTTVQTSKEAIMKAIEQATQAKNQDEFNNCINLIRTTSAGNPTTLNTLNENAFKVIGNVAEDLVIATAANKEEAFNNLETAFGLTKILADEKHDQAAVHFVVYQEITSGTTPSLSNVTIVGDENQKQLNTKVTKLVEATRRLQKFARQRQRSLTSKPPGLFGVHKTAKGNDATNDKNTGKTNDRKSTKLAG